MISNPTENCLKYRWARQSWMLIILAAAILLVLNGCGYFWVEPYGDIARDIKPVRADGQPVFMPENAPSITQGYFPLPERGPVGGEAGGHNGIDITADRGTPVLAPASGVVIKSYFEPLYGNHVELDLGRDEMGRLVHVKLLHLKKRLVREGDTVVRGQQVGTLGSTGILAAGLPHVHYAIFVKGEKQAAFEPINPHQLWADGVGIVTCFDSTMTWPDTPLKTTYPVPCRGVSWQ